MTETRQYIGFGDVEKFLVKSYKCITGGREFDIDKYGPYVDAVKHVLVPSLEKQILFCLERFVYNEEFQRSTYQPYLSRYKESVLTAYAKYNELGTSIEAMRDSFTIDHLVDFLGHSFLTNSRLEKIGNDLDKMGFERNWLGYVNVLNFINEKDFWVCSSSSSISTRQYSSICSPSNYKLLSEFNTENSHPVERTRGLKRPRKRAATHISRKHYKLERVAQVSDRPFRVTKSFYDQLARSWDLRDSLHTKRRLKRSSFANYRRKNQTTDWKNETLALLVRKINGADKTCVGNEEKKNAEVRTCLALPCRVEQLLSKLERADPSLGGYHCNFIKRKFQTKLYNVCSCLNNLLSRLDGKTINSIYLVSEIRKDYLNFKLKNSRQLFSARVMTCEALYRRGFRRDEPGQKLKSQSFWAAKKAEELFRGTERRYQEPISSIEISFSGCEAAGVATDRQNVINGLTRDPKDLEGSSSINDVMQKLELSPFRLQETEQSFRMRSKIQDIVRSIMMCTQQYSPRGQEGDLSVSIHAVVSASSFHAVDIEEEGLPADSKPSKPSTVSKIVSLMASEICSSRSKDTPARAESVKSCKSVVPKSCIRTREDGLRSGGSVKSDKSRASSSSRDYKPMNKNRYEVCGTSEVPKRSREFTGSCGCPLSKKMAVTIACEISNAIAMSKSPGNDKSDVIDVTVEIEESSDTTDSISRHTHLLPSMRSVRLGTSRRKYFRNDSGTSSGDEIPIQDNFTSMNKSMISSSTRGTIPAESYDRIKHLIREKVWKKCSDVDSCQPNSSKTIVSSGKYYLSCPSSKTSRVLLRREISESSSTSHDSLRRPVCNRRRRKPRTSSSIDESSPSKLSDCYSADLETCSETSAAATFDKNSIYGCIEDRLVNRHFREIVDECSDEAGDSPMYRDVESQVSSDFGLCSEEKEKLMSRYYDSEMSSENDSTFRQIYMAEDNGLSNVGIASQTDSEDSLSPGLCDYQRFEITQRPRRACGWSTCAIRPSNSAECPAKMKCRVKRRDRSYSPREKIFDFDPTNVIEKYKKRFRNIDRSLRAKLLQYVGYCKKIKKNLQKQICIDDIYGASRTSIPSNACRRHKYSGVYFGG